MPDNAPTIDNHNIPEMFAGGRFIYAIISGSTVVVTFTSPRWHPEDNTSAHHVIARMAMPLQKAQELVVELNDFLEKQGHAPSKAATQGLAKQ